MSLDIRGLDVIQPPPGGLRRLRHRLGAERRREARWRRARRATLAAAVVAAVGVGLVRLGVPRGPVDVPELELVRTGLGLVAPPPEPVTVVGRRRQDTAVQRVPLPTDTVVFYRIATTRAAATD